MWNGLAVSSPLLGSSPALSSLRPKAARHSISSTPSLVEECSPANWRSPLAESAGSKQPVFVALGKFDGMHQGHRLLAQQAASSGALPYLLSFSGMAEVLGWPARLPLVAASDRSRVLASWAPFCKGNQPRQRLIPFSMVRSLSPEQFVQALVEDLQVAGVVVGQNYRFGYKAAGDSKLLQSLGKSHNIQVDIVNLLEAGQGAVQGQVSSSKIRNALNCGHMQQVAESLGRPYRLISEVVPGAMCHQPSDLQTSFRISMKYLCNQPPMYDRRYSVTACTSEASSADGEMLESENGTVCVHENGIDFCKPLTAWAHQAVAAQPRFLALDFHPTE